MPDITITVTLSNRQLKILQALATANGMTPKQYALGVLKSFIKGQVIGRYKEQFNSKTEDELATLFGEL